MSCKNGLKMPVVLLDRLPLPSLPAYTAVSVALLACSLYYAAQNAAAVGDGPASSGSNEDVVNASTLGQEDQFEGIRALCWAFGRRCTTVLAFMVHEPFCIWPLVNMAYCILVLLGKCIQGAVFGELRVSETQAMKDTFWNFVFYKFIFVFGVLSVQRLEEVVLWCSWFTLLGFLHHLAQLARERAEYLSLSGSPGRERRRHLRLLGLLAAILFASGAMFLVCVAVGLLVSLNTFAFMAAECILLSLRTLQTMLRYSLHLYDVTHSTPTSPAHLGAAIFSVALPKSSPNSSTVSIAPPSEQRNISRDELNEPLDKSATSYEDVKQTNLPVLSSEAIDSELKSRESSSADMTPRSVTPEVNESSSSNQNPSVGANASQHSSQRGWVRGGGASYYLELLFELGALLLDLLHHIHMLLWCNILLSMASLSWLEQDPSCPTCRLPLAIGDPVAGTSAATGPGILGLMGSILGGLAGREQEQDEREAEPREQQQQINNNSHVFHFDGSRYVSWLPSFSVEAAHTQLGPGGHGEIQPSSQLHNMALQVQQMFPHFPLWALIADLRVSHSAELTVENILEGRLLPPAPMFNSDVMERPFLAPEPLPTTPHLPSNWEPAANGEEKIAFSQVASERQRTLARRREALLQQARRRYLEKGGMSPAGNLSTPSSSLRSEDGPSSSM
ncbi:hypothetical protein B566_EDAN004739 [Ephemera danica]|nr:hypothetical protein B566_EDAN004739 [Ephemera danica]